MAGTTRWRVGNSFFAAAVVILACTLIAFSANLVTDVGQPSNRDPKFIVHGLFCFSWVVLLVIQTRFIRQRSVAIHRRLGVFTAFVAVGVVLSTWYIQYSRFQGWAETPVLSRSNIIFISSFAALVAAGHLNRRRPEAHRRFMFLATLCMMGPIVDRVGGNTGISPYVTNPVLWNGLFLSFFAYDWLSARRIHRITYLGYAWLWVVWGISVPT